MGVISCNNERVVCKFLTAIYPNFPGFDAVQRVAEFIQQAQRLRQAVPQVVEFIPRVILNRNEKGHVDAGYLMKVALGTELRKITKLLPEEKEAIQNQFDTCVKAMLKAGYAIYDFNDDNVLWDGKTLTFVDLSEAGFKPIALENADTSDVIWRMSQMLAQK